MLLPSLIPPSDVAFSTLTPNSVNQEATALYNLSVSLDEGLFLGAARVNDFETAVHGVY
jgi:hypothetical protein